MPGMKSRLVLTLALAGCLLLLTTGACLVGWGFIPHAGLPWSDHPPGIHQGSRFYLPETAIGTHAPDTIGDPGLSSATASLNETTLKGFDGPFGIVYDPVNGYIYVTNSGSNNVSVIDPSNNRIIAYVPLGGLLNGANLVCDSLTGNVYVGSGSSILVIGGRTNTVISTIPIPIPGGALPDSMTFDTRLGRVVVLDGAGTNISFVNQTSLLATVSLPGQYATGAVYDSSNGQVYATSFSFPPCSGSCIVRSVHVSIINTATTVVTPTAYTMLFEFRMMYVPALDEIFDAGVNGNLSVFDPQSGKTVATLNLSAELGGLAYDSKNGLVYTTNRYFGNAYNASSITPGDNVTIVDPRTDRSVGSIPVWSEPVGIAYDDRTDELFVANMGSGSVSVINLTSTYHVQFTETGLPSGANWSVSLGGKTRVGPGPLDFVEPNGTFSYTVPSAVGYLPALAAGAVQVSGNDVSILVQFHPPSYPVTVHESGLPAGTNWSMDLAGQTLRSSGTSLLFSEPNGSYPFISGSVPGFAATPDHGNVSVSGSPVSLIVSYAPVPVSTASSLWLYLDLTLALVLAVLVAVFVLVGRRQRTRRGPDSPRVRSPT